MAGTVIIGDAAIAIKHVDELGQLYESDFVDQSLQETRIFTKDRFRKKLLDDYATRPDFKIAMLWRGQKITGYPYGFPLQQETLWWDGISPDEPLPSGYVEEDGCRTVALIDIVVKRDARGQKLGSQLHAAFLKEYLADRVTLLSEPVLQPAYSVFQHWGYERIGTTANTKSGRLVAVLVGQGRR